MVRICRPATLIIFLIAGPVFSDALEPLDAVNTFFEALSQNDADLAATVMIEDGLLNGYVEIGEEPQLIHVSISQFLDGMRNRTDAALERIWDVKVIEHRRLAVVWTPYDFFLNGEFHHCGVNSFNLIRTNAGWKIAGATYSVATDTCEDSPLGPPDFD